MERYRLGGLSALYAGSGVSAPWVQLPCLSVSSVYRNRAKGPRTKQMAAYKYPQYLRQWTTSDEFEKLYEPGSAGGWSGIYRCEGCGHEAVHTHDKPLPPQNHHTHTSSQGRIRWKLIVTDVKS